MSFGSLGAKNASPAPTCFASQNRSSERAREYMSLNFATRQFSIWPALTWLARPLAGINRLHLETRLLFSIPGRLCIFPLLFQLRASSVKGNGGAPLCLRDSQLHTRRHESAGRETSPQLAWSQNPPTQGYTPCRSKFEVASRTALPAMHSVEGCMLTAPQPSALSRPSRQL